MRLALAVFAFVTLLSRPAWAAESGVMIREEILRANASSTAAEIGGIGKDAKVEILARKGGWTQVRHEGGTGWVRVLSVRKGEASRTDAGAEVVGALSLGLTRRDPGRVTATTGLRGLGEEELRAARYDPAQLQKLDGYAAGESEARQFATSGGLRSRSVDYLSAPGGVGSSSSGSNAGGHNFMEGN